MANLLILKRRMKAAQNVSKTTKAMQMIAASKMKKAQSAALATRPYVEKLTQITKESIEKAGETFSHPYLENHADNNKTLLIVLSPDKGLCGGLITNLLREYTNFVQKDPQVLNIVVGKKLETKLTLLKREIVATFPFGTTNPTFDAVYPISQLIEQYYGEKKVANVKILYSEFTSIFTQKPKVIDLLPLRLTDITHTSKESKTEYLFEPQATQLLPELLKHYLEMNIYQQLLESFVSEQASRMIAMQNATNNANDIIEDLRLEYNKTRQAKITGEILDLTGTFSTNDYEGK